jgi:hypothetical protein
MVSHMVSPDSGESVTQDRAAVLASAEVLLREEFGQAWQHFRHLETMRGQYLAFAFTVTLASLAASIPLVAGVDEVDGTTLLLAGVFVLLYCLVIGFLYFSVRKIRIVLAHYRRTIEDIRHHFFHRARGDLGFDVARLDLADRTYTVLGWRLFRLQTTSESILVAFLAIGGVAEAACAGGVLTLAHTWWQATLAVVSFVCVGLVLAAVSRFAWVQRDDEFSSQVHQ